MISKSNLFILLLFNSLLLFGSYNTPFINTDETLKLSYGMDKIDVENELGKPLYVLSINSEKNEIVVGPKDKLIKRKIKLRDVNILSNNNDFKKDVYVKIRSTGKLIKSKINIENNGAEVVLLEDEYGISPGQACVFYSKDKNGDKVLGGGWIAKN